MAGNTIEFITTGAAPTPAGHYSQATRYQNTLYISGQLPVHPDGRHSHGDPFDVQATIALDNVLAIRAAAGGTAADLVKVTVYIVGVAHWPAFNALYARRLGDHRPARAVVPVPELHHGYLVEIEAIARVR